MSEPVENVTPPQLPELETAFIIMKTPDGSWRVTSDVTSPFSISRLATRADIRMGAAEISHLVSQQDLAALVASVLKASEENS